MNKISLDSDIEFMEDEMQLFIQVLENAISRFNNGTPIEKVAQQMLDELEEFGIAIV